MVEIRDLTAGYGGKQVLNNISLNIPTGKVTVLLGPNGCGKSTLLKAVCGVLSAQSGRVLLAGEDLLTLPSDLRAQKVAYLPQNRQVPDITVERLVLHGRFPYLGYPRRYRQEDYAAAVAAMGQMELLEVADVPVENLSGGQRQKVYIAMALAQDTPIILLDEPTTYLDVQHQLQVMQHAKWLAQQGKTVLMVLHDLPNAFRTADHMVLMEQGRVVYEGDPEQLYASGEAGRVFEVHLGRVATEAGWQYYCRECDL